jgi:hypothetical protein
MRLVDADVLREKLTARATGASDKSLAMKH